tara:strand:- start:21722 stop:23209 length:1488 start_codon:yes stop_codon:yes gene_type:complete
MLLVGSILSSGSASALEACGSVASLEGATCEQFKVQFDLSKCEKDIGTVVAVPSCEGDKVVATYKTKTANYRAIFEPKQLGWGKVSYELQGKIWKHIKKNKIVVKDIVKKDPVPLPAPVKPVEPAVREVASVFAPPPPPAPSKIKEEELTNIANLFSGVSIKGSVDAYYAVNSNNPAPLTGTPTASAPQVQNKYHVFDTYHDDLQLSFARLQIQKRSDDVTTTLDFGYGPTMQIVSGTKTDAAQFNLKQAIIGYKPSDKVNIEIGRFVTFLGFELIETQDNWNYSRGLLFGYFVPFWHQGAKVTYSINDTVSVMGVVANGWNNSYEDNRNRSYGAQIAWVPSANGSLYVSALSGPDATPTNVNPDATIEVRTVVDVVGTYKPNDNLSLGFNFDYLSHKKNATGVAGYLRYQIDPKWAVSPRIEVVEDKDNLAMGESLDGGQKLSSYTLTLERKLNPNLILRLEGRYDTSNNKVFTSNNEPKSSQTVGILGITASF